MSKQVSDETVERCRNLMLDEKERSCQQLSDDLGISKTSGLGAMAALHRRNIVSVVRYARAENSASWVRVFKIGHQPDAEKPVGPDQSKRAYLKREREHLRAARAKPGNPFRHPQDIALFGEPAPILASTKWRGRTIKQSMSTNEEEQAA